MRQLKIVAYTTTTFKSKRTGRSLVYKVARALCGLGRVAEAVGQSAVAENYCHETFKALDHLQLHLPSVEPLAGLARLCLLPNPNTDARRALLWVAKILVCLAEKPELAGVANPI